MKTSCRSWWRNCALETDSEIQDIDRIEDDISPITPNVSRIRELIGSLELVALAVASAIIKIYMISLFAFTGLA